jgi:hypothetical protein
MHSFNNFDSTMEAVWTWDSETGEQLLLDIKTGFILAKKDKDGNIVETRSK